MTSPRIEIIKELRALEQFCTFKSVRTGEENERFLKDYLADVQDFPLVAIQKACAKWRKTGATKFPTPGQLIPLIREALPPEERPRVEAWRPISDAEYEALSLSGKVRHHQILAAEARRKAGPMWKNPLGATMAKAVKGHVAAHELPDTHRRWSDIAAGHESEAHRLRTYMHRHQMAAE